MRFTGILVACALGFGWIVVSAWAAEPAEPAHFHHVRLNTTDPEETLEFYKRYFGAVEVKYHGEAPALFTERSFILLNHVDSPPRTGPTTAISHIGWAAVTGHDEYEWLKSQGVEFQTEIGKLGINYGMYVYGPEKELVELWTGGKNHRFDHVHLWATDVEKSADWFRTHLGLQPRVMPEPQIQDSENIAAIRMAFVQCDNVNIVFFERPNFESIWWPGSNYTEEEGPQGDFEPTRGHVIDHIGFSYRDIEPVYERMKANGAEVLSPIAEDPETGHQSFYALAPDNMLVEIVRARPIPQASWE